MESEVMFVSEGKVEIDIKEYRQLIEKCASLEAKDNSYYSRYWELRTKYENVSEEIEVLRATIKRLTEMENEDGRREE